MDPKTDIKIVRLDTGDVRHETDHMADFRRKILECEPMYPGIGKWLRSKVSPGIISGERAAFVGYLGDQPVVTAVAKRGADAKICHLKIADHLQNTNLGEVFFSLMAIELRAGKIKPSEAHFTLPQSLWDTKHDFFDSFGFSNVELHDNQYRSFDPELKSRAVFGDVWTSVLSKMPKLASMYTLGGFSLDSALLLSIRPKYSQMILRGEKTVELRRKFSTRWEKSLVNLYESSPTQGLVGEAVIDKVHHLSVSSIWRQFAGRIGCSKKELQEYASGVNKLYALELAHVRPYRAPISVAWAETLLSESLVAPQSYLTLEENKNWGQAISLSAYMHGCFVGVSKRSQALRDKFAMAPVASANTLEVQQPGEVTEQLSLPFFL
jgi:predicted transcriptional regulator